MAWIVLDLDNTLVEETEQGTMPTDGAIEAVHMLAGEGHRLTVYTSRFAPMPETAKHRLKEHILEELIQLGFPDLEVWTGSTKPAADIFIGDNHITYDQDWGLALAQLQQMLEDRGLMNAALPDDGMTPEFEDEAEQTMGEEEPVEE